MRPILAQLRNNIGIKEVVHSLFELNRSASAIPPSWRNVDVVRTGGVEEDVFQATAGAIFQLIGTFDGLDLPPLIDWNKHSGLHAVFGDDLRALLERGLDEVAQRRRDVECGRGHDALQWLCTGILNQSFRHSHLRRGRG